MNALSIASFVKCLFDLACVCSVEVDSRIQNKDICFEAVVAESTHPSHRVLVRSFRVGLRLQPTLLWFTPTDKNMREVPRLPKDAYFHFAGNRKHFANKQQQQIK